MSSMLPEIAHKDRLILRGLAGELAELAARPVEDDKKKLWYDHNALRPTRPVVFCDPENGWNEIITQDMLVCEGATARAWEQDYRKSLFWAREMCDDKVTLAECGVGYSGELTGWGLQETIIGAGKGKAYVWEPPLKDLSDLSGLEFPRVTIDWKRSEERFEMVGEFLGDILTPVRRSSWWWSLGLTNPLVRLRGLEQMMYDVLDRPAEMHSLMAFLRDGTMALLDSLEEQGVLTLNNRGDYVGSGGFGWTDELPAGDFDGRVRCRDIWGFAESQETVGFSPEMYEEFIFPYEAPIMARFGLNCYGCCEPLDRRWDVVKRLPNLRRVSVSAWADLGAMAEHLGSKYILSLKPNPSALAMPSFDEGFIRSTLREAMETSAGCRVEVVMKDCHTICNDPYRVVRWTQIAREEAERVSG